MPRNGSEVYSRPAGTTAISGATIESAKFNELMADIANDLNVARPVVAGGTGAGTPEIARTNLGVAIGTDVQGFDAGLASIAGLTVAADQGIYATGADTYATFALGSLSRTLLANTTEAGFRSTLGVAVVIDEDNFATDSATRPPSQQSTKVYVDTSVAGKAIGVGQTWTDRTGSRSSGTAYRNTSGRPISVIITHTSAGSGNVSVSNTGIGYTDIAQAVISATGMVVSFIVPDGVYYKTTGGVSRWVELD